MGTKIERKYYDNAKAKRESYLRQVDEELAQRTDEEIAADKEESKRFLDRAFAEVAKKSIEHPKMLNPQKVKTFEKLKKAALWLAEFNDLNICIEDVGQHGAHIKFEAEAYIIQSFGDPIEKDIFLNLIKHCDDLVISSSNGLLTMQFFYEFCDEL